MTSTIADRLAVESVIDHHVALREQLTERVDTLMHAVEANSGKWEASKLALLDFVDNTLFPHAKAEEQTLYPAAAEHTEGKALVEAMVSDHALMMSMAEKIRHSQSPVAIAAEANAMRVLFESHMDKEDERILPLLEHARGVSIAALLAGMRELLGEKKPE